MEREGHVTVPLISAPSGGMAASPGDGQLSQCSVVSCKTILSSSPPAVEQRVW